MKLCPKCGNQFSDDANFCPVDAGRLEPIAENAPFADGQSGISALAGRFMVGARIGGGVTGDVHASRDRQGGGACVVKLVDAAVFPTPLLMQRTERELKQLERLDADGVIKVLDHGKRDGRLWIATERFEGRPLRDVVAESGPMPLDRAIRIVLAVGNALSEAARLGVIHRDLAPKNILIGADDRIKVINFGVAVPASDKVQGVPEFVAPEQIEGKPVDQRSNIYSLGTLLYFLVAGQPPYTGDAESVYRSHLAGTPTPLGQAASVPPEIDALVTKALERTSSKRYMTLRQLLGDLESHLGGNPATTQPLGRAGAATVDARGKPQAKESNRTIIGLPAFERPKPDTIPMAPSAAPSVVVTPAAAATPPRTDIMPAPPVEPAPVPQAAKANLAPPLAQPRPSDSDSVARDDTAPAPVIARAVRPASESGTTASGKDKKRKSGKLDAKPKGGPKFRETMWFKKGELDEAAAEAAAKGDDASSDRADHLPIEDRYKDDGSLTSQDRERLSLRTGGTQMMEAVRDGADSDDVSDLASELARGRGMLIAAVAGAVVVVVVLIVLFAT